MRLFEIADMREPDIKEITEMLLRDCKPFLNEIDGQIYKHSLYRGMNQYNTNFGKHEPRLVDRIPMNTPDSVHDEMNLWFKHKYGRPFRDGVFTTGHRSHARSYGPTYAIFPIGDFEYIWNPKIDDMFNLLMAVSFKGIPQLLNEYEPYFRQDGLKEAIMAKVEVMLWTEEYYYMSMETRNKIGRYLL